MSKKGVLELTEMKRRGEKIAWLTAYDYPTATFEEAAGIDMILMSPDTTDDELAREENRPGVVVLTTDSLLMEQRVLRDGVVPAVWVPPSLKPREQMRLIFDELRLPQRESLCMNCGGRLRPVDKESVQERIPPRTRLWLDAYFLCERCGQLFWYGTHWERIQRRLQQCLTND